MCDHRSKNFICCVVFAIIVICVAVTIVTCVIIFTTPSKYETVKVVKELIRINDKPEKPMTFENSAFETLLYETITTTTSIIPNNNTTTTTTTTTTIALMNTTESLAITTATLPLTTTTKKINENPCRNGGIYIYDTKKCVCKDHISGEFCEEGKKLKK